MLRARQSRREEPLDEVAPAAIPDVVVRADAEAIRTGAQAEVRGAADVAKTFAGRARAARPALIDGQPGLVWTTGGKARVVFGITIVGGEIVAIELVAEPQRVSE